MSLVLRLFRALEQEVADDLVSEPAFIENNILLLLHFLPLLVDDQDDLLLLCLSCVPSE